MSQMQTSLILTGDARGLIAATSQGETALKKLDTATEAVGRASTQTAGELTKLAAQEKSVESSVEQGTTAMQQQIAALVRLNVTSSSAQQSAATFNTALEQGTVRFDALRASLDPLYRSSRQYEAVVQESQRAVLSGAATQGEANRVMALAEAQYLATGTAAQSMGRSNNMAAGQLGNITAQFNDIGVMLAAGQNPLQLALQQGTQLNQVFAQLGGGRAALKATASALVSMINPVSLATIGIIAGGAALLQWATSAGEAADDGETFGKVLEELGQQAKDARLEVDLFLGGFDTAAELNATRQIEELRRQADALRASAESMGGFSRREQGVSQADTLSQADDLDAQADAAQRKLDLSNQEVATAQTLKTLQAEMAERAEQENQALIAQAKARAEGMVVAQEMLTVLQEEFAIAQAIARYGEDSRQVTELRVDAERRVFEAQLESLDASDAIKIELLAAWDAVNGMAAVDVASNIAAGADQASRMANELSRAVGNAIALANQGVGDVERARINYDYRDNPVGRAGALAEAEFKSRTDIPSMVNLPDGLASDLKEQKEAFVGARMEAARYNESLQAWRKEQTEAARAERSGSSAGKSAAKKRLAEQKRALKDEERVIKDIRSQMGRLSPSYARDTEELLRWRENALETLNPAREGYEAFASDVETIFGERLAQAYREDLDRRTDWASGVERAFLDINEDTKTWAETGENITRKWSSGLEDAFVEMSRTGKVEVGDLVDYTLEQFQRLAYQKAIQPGIEAGFGFLSDFIGGFFPGAAGAGAAAGGTTMTQSHAGSTIGTGGVRRSYGAGSPLRADERLTVTTLGQRVFTPEQIGNGATVVDALAKAAANPSGGGAGMVFAPQISIQNLGSTPVQGQMEESSDGQGKRSYKLVLADEVGAAMSQPGGGARKALKRGGLKTPRPQR